MKQVILAITLGLAQVVFADGDKGHSPKAIDYSKAEATPFGIAADPRKAKRTILIDMSDNLRFAPSEIEVRRGEIVRFIATNKGQVPHEIVLGTMGDLKRHAALMKKFPSMEHDEPYMAHVAPGKAEIVVWQFTRAGEFYYGCLVPGHFEAGMMGKIKVTQ